MLETAAVVLAVSQVRRARALAPDDDDDDDDDDGGDDDDDEKEEKDENVGPPQRKRKGPGSSEGSNSNPNSNFSSSAASSSSASTAIEELQQSVHSLGDAVQKSQALLQFTDHRVDALSGVVNTIVEPATGERQGQRQHQIGGECGGRRLPPPQQPPAAPLEPPPPTISMSMVGQVLADTELRSRQLELADEIRALI